MAPAKCKTIHFEQNPVSTSEQSRDIRSVQVALKNTDLNIWQSLVQNLLGDFPITSERL